MASRWSALPKGWLTIAFLDDAMDYLPAILETEIPAHNPETEMVVADNPVLQENGSYKQAWLVKPKPLDLAIAYRNFYNQLMDSVALRAIEAQAVTSPPLILAALKLSNYLADAKTGHPNVPAIQQSLTTIAELATNLSPANWAEIGALLESCGLADIYQLPGVAGG